MGYVPQRHPETRLTVFEAVLMGRKPHIRWSLGEDDYALVENIIEQVGIAHLAMRPVSDLSGGEVQKVIIARALAQSPDILLLDEPTSNLDLKNQLEVMRLIRRIAETQGLSAVVVIHDLNIALRFADRFLFLKDRQIHAVCTKSNLTPETIRQVYGVEVALKKFGDQTLVVPICE
jgi:iron complex transport system ATP-binding protein